MARANVVRASSTNDDLRPVTPRLKTVEQARLLLAIAAALDTSLREQAAKSSGMSREILRDGLVRCDEESPDGLNKHRRMPWARQQISIRRIPEVGISHLLNLCPHHGACSTMKSFSSLDPLL